MAKYLLANLTNPPHVLRRASFATDVEMFSSASPPLQPPTPPTPPTPPRPAPAPAAAGTAAAAAVKEEQEEPKADAHSASTDVAELLGVTGLPKSNMTVDEIARCAMPDTTATDGGGGGSGSGNCLPRASFLAYLEHVAAIIGTPEFLGLTLHVPVSDNSAASQLWDIEVAREAILALENEHASALGFGAENPFEKHRLRSGHSNLAYHVYSMAALAHLCVVSQEMFGIRVISARQGVVPQQLAPHDVDSLLEAAIARECEGTIVSYKLREAMKDTMHMHVNFAAARSLVRLYGRMTRRAVPELECPVDRLAARRMASEFSKMRSRFVDARVWRCRENPVGVLDLSQTPLPIVAQDGDEEEEEEEEEEFEIEEVEDWQVVEDVEKAVCLVCGENAEPVFRSVVPDKSHDKGFARVAFCSFACFDEFSL